MGPMDNTKIAPSLAATSKQLDKKLKTDKLSQSLNDENRPTPQSLKEQGVLPNSVASSLSATAVKLENAQKSDALRQQLTDRPNVDELADANIFTSHPSEKQQKTDKLKNNLKNREELENLHKQNIITPNIAPQFAAKQRELEQAKKMDIIQQKLNDKD